MKRASVFWLNYKHPADKTLKRLKRGYPNTRFTVFAPPDAVEAIRRIQHVDRVIPWTQMNRSLRYQASLVREIRNSHYDLTVIPLYSLSETYGHSAQVLLLFTGNKRKDLFDLERCVAMSLNNFAIIRNVAKQGIKNGLGKLRFFLTMHFVSFMTSKDVIKVKRLAESGEMGRILIINSSPNLGDVLITTPLIRRIKERFSSAYIAVLTTESGENILAGNPHIDKLITYEFPYTPYGVTKTPQKPSLKTKIELMRLLRRERFEIVLDIHGHKDGLFLTALAGVKYRLGFSSHYGRIQNCFTRTVAGPCDRDSQLISGRTWADYVTDLGDELLLSRTKGGNENHDFYFSADDGKWAGEFLRLNGIRRNSLVACVHPGAGIDEDNKQWRIEKFARLMDLMYERYGMSSIITGTIAEAKLAKQIGGLTKIAKPIVASGQTTLGQLGALISESDLLVCNNTGPMHVATAVGTPVVTISGPSQSPWYPTGEADIVVRADIDCPPCGVRICKRQDHACIESITVQEVFRAIESQVLGCQVSQQSISQATVSNEEIQ